MIENITIGKNYSWFPIINRYNTNMIYKGININPKRENIETIDSITNGRSTQIHP